MPGSRRSIVPWSLGQIGDMSAIQPLIEANAATTSADATSRLFPSIFTKAFLRPHSIAHHNTARPTQSAFLAAIRAFFRSRVSISLEILALRQQVAVLKRKRPRPSLNRLDRLSCANILSELHAAIFCSRYS
jgi:hypothetical protein